MVKKHAAVNKGRCAACGACTKVCPRAAITIYKGCYAEVSQTLCVGCGKCTYICPAGCISLAERQDV